jgi:alpha-tubulin suppressor-like RCC1 family protein
MAVNESNTIQYTVTTTNTADGTVLYWKTTGNTTNSDIAGGNTGSITVTNNQAFINLTIAADATTDGSKTLGISLLSGSVNGTPLINTASLIVVNDTSLTPLLGFTSIPSSINEGSAGTFNVTSSLANGSTGYWTINNVTSADADFVAISGSFTVTGGVASFTVTPSTDASTEGAQTFTVSLRIDSISGAVQATSSSVTINDTSLSPPAGALYAWGRNNYTQLGLNDTINRSSPVQVGSDTNWSKIEVGTNGALALKNDSTLWSWGRNYGGQLGFNDRVYRSSPVQIGSGTTWNQISRSAQGSQSAAIKTDGTLWFWGVNDSGQLGLNDRVNRSSPTQIGTDTWSLISCGQYCNAAIKTNGTLWTWGQNNEGQLALGDQIFRSSPVQVGALTNWSQVSVNGTASAAVKTDGTLWTWGNNQAGQNALGNTVGYVRRLSPQQVGSLTNWSMVKFGVYSCLALKTDGTMWSWGSNSNGVLGHNQPQYRNTSSPVQIGTDTTWSKITLGYMAAAAIKTNGTLWLWGQNGYYGNLGFNTRAVYKSSPTQLGSGTNWNQVSTAVEHTLALTLV